MVDHSFGTYVIPTPSSLSPIPEEVERIARQTKELVEIASSLDARLSNYMKAPGKISPDNISKPGADFSAFRSGLVLIQVDLSQVSAMLLSILDRLEI